MWFSYFILVPYISKLLIPGHAITGETYTQQPEGEKLEELGWETLPRPPYSPDISPSDYHLFRSIRNHLAGNKFKDVQEVEKWLADFLAIKQANFYAEGIHSLHGRWKQILLTNGEYIVD
ncbi:unnamed protein product, partial [Mesorhabditis belari]|uniref:Histone-lysine N-methyltransferase SETMAR n=1 Tax=Mesorhabditis belari TaxID=2138241 RepID=A0AAF3EXI8_9BILA